MPRSNATALKRKPGLRSSRAQAYALT